MSKTIFNSTWYNAKPSWAASLTVYETARTDTSATILLSLGLKVSGTYSGESPSSSWYAYNIMWYATADKVESASTAIKSSGTWYGTDDMRWFQKTIVIPATMSSKEIDIYTEFYSSNGGGSSIAKSISGKFTISSRNTAPTWNTGNISLNINGTNYTDTSKTYIIPENISSITVTSPTSSDAETSAANMRYAIDRVIGSTCTQIKGFTTGTSISDTSIISQNTNLWHYRSLASDEIGVTPGTYKYSAAVMRNVFTAPTVANAGTITENSNTVSFSVTAGYNTQVSGDTVSLCTNNTVTYELYTIMNGIAVTRGTAATSGTNTITISTSDPGTGIFINRNHLKDYVKDDGYTGVLTCALKATNAYGSTTWTYFAFYIDLRASATGTSITSITGQIGSYYFPAKKELTVNWSAGSTSTGEEIRYSVQYSYNNSTWATVISGLTGTTSAIVSSVTPNETSARTVYFRVGYTTSAGTTYSPTSQITAHYWGVPTLTINYTRTATTATVTGVITINSSARGDSGTQVVSARYSGNGMTGNVTLTDVNQIRDYSVTFTGLVSTSSFPVTISVKDTVMNINGDDDVIITTSITGEVPALSMGQKGVAIKGNNGDNGDDAFVVYGSARTTNDFTLANKISATGFSVANKQVLYGGGTTLYLGNPSLSDIKIEGNRAEAFQVSYAGNNYKIYHEGNPPPGSSGGGTAIKTLQNGFVAHRGFHKRAPENSLKAIAEAGKLGFVACELDPRLTSDGVFVLMHDATVDRTTDGTGSIESKTLAQVKALKIDAPAGIIDDYEVIKVPTLEEAIQELAYWGMGVNIDGQYADWNEAQVKTLYNLLIKYNLEEISMVSSAIASTRPTFAQHAPKLAQLIVTTPAELNNVLTTYSYIPKLIIGMKSNDATAAAIQTCNEKEIPVFLYENYAVSHATMHLGKGVNYIETDNILPQGGLKK